MQFRYMAYTLQQGVVTGRLEAPDQAEAGAEIVRRGLKPLRVIPARTLPSIDTLFPSLFRVKASELVRLSRELATVLASGGSLSRALELAQDESSSRLMRRTVAAIRSSLDDGSSLSESLGEHPKVFDRLFVSVVRVGEYTGHLAPALEQLAGMLERSHEARQKAIRTMMYPMAIMGLSFVTLGVLMVVALPPLLKVFDQMGTEIPALTRWAVAMVGGFKNNLPYIMLGIVGSGFLYWLARQLPSVREWMDEAQLQLPLVGRLVIAGELSRFCRTLTVLLDAGVSPAMALNLSIDGCKNHAVNQAMSEAEESLMAGKSLTEALAQSPVLPRLFVELIEIGEETNSLQRTMNDAAKTYEEEFERRISGFIAVLEPASTLVVGGIVGFIAFSMFVPIYSSLDAFG